MQSSWILSPFLTSVGPQHKLHHSPLTSKPRVSFMMIIHTVYLVIKAARIIGRKQKTEKRTSTFGCCILDVQWDEDFLTPEPLADKPLLAGRPPDRLLSSMCFSYHTCIRFTSFVNMKLATFPDIMLLYTK